MARSIVFVLHGTGLRTNEILGRALMATESVARAEALSSARARRDHARSSRTLLALLCPLAALLEACASPSVRPFADATEELRSVVLAEEEQLLADARRLLHHAEITGTREGQGYAGLTRVLDAFEVNRPASEPALDAAVRYSQALARISERAESGSEAVGTILGAANSVSAAFTTGAGLAAVDATIRQPIEALFAAIARVDGQQKLLEIMASTQERDPPGVVPAFRDAMRVVSTDVYAALAAAIDANAASIFNDAYSDPDRWFTQVDGLSCQSFYREHMLDAVAVSPPSGATAPFTAQCVPDVDLPLAERALRLELLDERTREVIGAREARREIDAAVDAHLRFASALVNAVDAWAAEHESVYRYLDRCGGFRVLSRRCAELHVDRFREEIVDLEAIMNGARP